ncbi:MAG: ABC transporter substrate-binding protein [Gemmatimonadaceae bacterium]|nr:ABC transporter substrate-binding protein [Gemmatimonadaceae bacterium]
MRRHALSVGVLMAATALSCTGCTDANKTAAGSATPTKLRVSLPLHLSAAPLMIAQDEGFFRDERLDIEFLPGLPHDESLVALVSGDLDVRPGPVSVGFLSAVAQGAKIRITAGMGYLARDGCTFYGAVLRSGLDDAHSAQVKRIRTSLDGAQRYVTDAMLAQRALSLTSVESVRLPEAVIESSMKTGAIDAAAASEPALSRIAKSGTRWLSGQDAAPDFQWAVITFGDRLLHRDRDAGVRFLRAYRRGIAQYNQGKTARNVAIIAKATGESPEIIRDACWVSFQDDSRINWSSIDAFQTFAQREKLMVKTIQQSDVWDSTFVSASDSTRASKTP